MRILLGSISVLPTHVGVILLIFALCLPVIRTTHTRGGDPNSGVNTYLPDMYYPHTWG